MLSIQITLLDSGEYNLKIYHKAKLLVTRRLFTTDPITVFESLETILKCDSGCREAISAATDTHD